MVMTTEKCDPTVGCFIAALVVAIIMLVLLILAILLLVVLILLLLVMMLMFVLIIVVILSKGVFKHTILVMIMPALKIGDFCTQLAVIVHYWMYVFLHGL